MGNTLSFNSPDLAGAVSSPGADDPVAALSTSYAFGPTNVNAFGLPATLTAAGGDGAAPVEVTPTITAPARVGGADLTFVCNPFPEGVSIGSIICPGAINTNFGSGTATLNFEGGDVNAPGYYSAEYLFSLTTLVIVGGGGGQAPVPVTTTTTTTVISDATTVTEPGPLCPTSTPPSSTSRPAGTGTGFSSRSNVPSGSVRPSGSIGPSGSVRPSGSVKPSGTSGASGSIRSSASIKPSGSLGPSGNVSTSASSRSPSGGSDTHNPSGSSSPSGSGVKATSSSSGHIPSGTGYIRSTSGSLGSSRSYGGPRSHISTIINPSVSSTITSTRYITTISTTIITEYASQTSSGHGNSGAPTVITKTITSIETEYIVICPSTPTPYPLPHTAPTTTLILTSTHYVCPTATAPVCSGSTGGVHQKRDAGFAPPDYTLFGGATGPTITNDGTLPTTTTVTETETSYINTVTETAVCTPGVLDPPVLRRGPVRVRREWVAPWA